MFVIFHSIKVVGWVWPESPVFESATSRLREAVKMVGE